MGTSELVERKRAAGPSEISILVNGIRILIPNTVETIGSVLIWKDAVEAPPTTISIFEPRTDSRLETDVQWIFITEAVVVKNELRIVNEQGDKYRPNLLTLKVRKSFL